METLIWLIKPGENYISSVLWFPMLLLSEVKFACGTKSEQNTLSTKKFGKNQMFSHKDFGIRTLTWVHNFWISQLDFSPKHKEWRDVDSRCGQWQLNYVKKTCQSALDPAQLFQENDLENKQISINLPKIHFILNCFKILNEIFEED